MYTYMNRNKYYFPIIMLIIFIGCASCKKFLDKKINNKLVTPSSLSDLQSLLDDPSMNQAATPSYGETSCDEYFLTNDMYDETESIQAGSHYLYIWKAYPTTGSSNDWGKCYNSVYNANLVLDLLGNISADNQNQTERNNVKGSALFYRGYYFLWLLWNYSNAYDSTSSNTDLGIVLRLTSNPNIQSVRGNNEQCYRQVINDTKSAIPLLPDYPLIATRPSKSAAYGLLARCYLSMRDYKNALLYADSCLQLDSQLMDFNDPAVYASTIAASAPFLQLNKEIFFYSEMNNDNYLCSTLSFSRIDTTLYKAYADNDLRKPAFYLINSDGYSSFKGTYGNLASFCFSGMATDEMYLTRAECYIRTGQEQKGLNDLNTLLNNRYKRGSFQQVTALSEQDALDIVLQEREKELVMRGMRWIDIKRLNKESKNIVLKRFEDGETFTLSPNAGFYALPIPSDIISLTGIQQNGK